MDALKPSNSKKVTLTMRGGFFTKFATLAHCAVAPRVTTNFLWEIILLPHAAAVSEMHLV